MMQAEFKKKVQSLFKQQERLITERNIKTPGGNDFVPGSRDFWVFDAAVRYRLPIGSGGGN